jgi:hypothetical protein
MRRRAMRKGPGKVTVGWHRVGVPVFLSYQLSEISKLRDYRADSMYHCWTEYDDDSVPRHWLVSMCGERRIRDASNVCFLVSPPTGNGATICGTCRLRHESRTLENQAGGQVLSQAGTESGVR